MSMITLENFNEYNRDKVIGNSLYRICKDNKTNKWYIYESFNDGITNVGNREYYNESLEVVINKVNKINKEKEIVSMRFGSV